MCATGRTTFQLPAVRRLLDRIRDLVGGEAADELTPVGAGAQPGVNGLQISGFIGKAGVSRANRSGQRVFINGRAVENGTVNQALREGYHTALMKGRYPVAYLFLQMDPAAVDVNVHPAKREVRFREPGSVREALVAAVRRTLEAGRADWSRSFHQPPLPEQARPATGAEATTVAESAADTRFCAHDDAGVPHAGLQRAGFVSDGAARADRHACRAKLVRISPGGWIDKPRSSPKRSACSEEKRDGGRLLQNSRGARQIVRADGECQRPGSRRSARGA